MGEARARGSLEQRVVGAKERYGQLSPEERKRADWARLPASVKRRRRNAASVAAAIALTAQILASPAN